MLINVFDYTITSYGESIASADNVNHAVIMATALLEAKIIDTAEVMNTFTGEIFWQGKAVPAKTVAVAVISDNTSEAYPPAPDPRPKQWLCKFTSALYGDYELFTICGADETEAVKKAWEYMELMGHELNEWELSEFVKDF